MSLARASLAAKHQLEGLRTERDIYKFSFSYSFSFFDVKRCENAKKVDIYQHELQRNHSQVEMYNSL